ncbi:MAG: HNH endonuclease [Ardenticatenaceae bacterium]|nr:HNH endonuclease [Ardenticatenaceae bacterium]
MMRWRWDQGRLDYFNYDNLRRIAQVLVELNGIDIQTPNFDPLREPLVNHTGLPFAPITYTVWRNYARIFKWTLIASRIDRNLMVTDVCRKIADTTENGWGIDEYLSFIISRIYYPSPATQQYEITDERNFPFCAILRYLIAKFKQQGDASITLDETFSYLVGNNIQGIEPLESFLNLPPTNRKAQGDEGRQVREMLIFLAQSSFLKWNNSSLILDVMNGDGDTIYQLEQIATPLLLPQNADSDAEVIRLATIDATQIQPIVSIAREIQDDLIFTEGKRVRVTHLRVERSPRLRRMFFANLPLPYFCDMCLEDMNERYPWTDNLLEIHHLLPLSSVIRLTRVGTSFDDLVPLCPNCHKAVHAYYRNWLRTNEQQDFWGVQQAKSVYNEIKEQMG